MSDNLIQIGTAAIDPELDLFDEIELKQSVTQLSWPTIIKSQIFKILLIMSATPERVKKRPKRTRT